MDSVIARDVDAPRLMLVVRPRLLGDTLARALRAEGLTVIVPEPDGISPQPADVDVAIVTEPPAGMIDVPLVIRLPAAADHGIGTVTRRGHPEEPVELADISSVVATVQIDRSRQG